MPVLQHLFLVLRVCPCYNQGNDSSSCEHARAGFDDPTQIFGNLNSVWASCPRFYLPCKAGFAVYTELGGAVTALLLVSRLASLKLSVAPLWLQWSQAVRRRRSNSSSVASAGKGGSLRDNIQETFLPCKGWVQGSSEPRCAEQSRAITKPCGKFYFLKVPVFSSFFGMAILWGVNRTIYGPDSERHLSTYIMLNILEMEIMMLTSFLKWPCCFQVLPLWQ